MNPFQQIPAAVRQWLYIGYGVATLAVTSTAAGYGATGHHVPDVVIGVGAALVPIGTALGVTAASNVKPDSES